MRKFSKYYLIISLSSVAATCYGQSREVTKVLHKTMSDTFGMRPMDREILPVYLGDTPPSNVKVRYY